MEDMVDIVAVCLRDELSLGYPVRVLLHGRTGSGKTHAARAIAAACSAKTGCDVVLVDVCLDGPAQCAEAVWGVVQDAGRAGVCLVLHGMECMPAPHQHQVADAIASAGKGVHIVAETLCRDSIATCMSSVLGVHEVSMDADRAAAILQARHCGPEGAAAVAAAARLAADQAPTNLHTATRLFRDTFLPFKQLHTPAVAI